jgi:hypothetical protein
MGTQPVAGRTRRVSEPRLFKGRLQTNGYYACESLANERKGELTRVACWAHGRRGSHEALAESRWAAWFVRQIELLSSVEKLLREQKAGPRLRAAMRNWQCRPVFERLRAAKELVGHRAPCPNKSKPGRSWSLRQPDKLTRAGSAPPHFRPAAWIWLLSPAKAEINLDF